MYPYSSKFSSVISLIQILKVVFNFKTSSSLMLLLILWPQVCFTCSTLFKIRSAVGSAYFLNHLLQSLFCFLSFLLLHFFINHYSKIITQLANPLIITLPLSQFKAGAETMTQQWKKTISLRQIQRGKCLLSFVHFGVCMFHFKEHC